MTKQKFIIFTIIASITYFPNFSMTIQKEKKTEEYNKIENVKSDFLPLDIEEKRLISNGNKLIFAIEKYFSEKDDYPPSLESLVPDYIAEIPKTGFKRFYLLSPKTEEAVFRYSFSSVKENPEFAGYTISVRYGMFDEWHYSSKTKLWEWENH